MADRDWHYLEWTPERVEAFWNFTANWPAHHDDYFTRQVGRGVIRFAKSLIPFTQEVVDFGCGMGDLLEFMLEEGVPCRGVDSSAGSVDFVNERFGGRAGWKGAIVSADGRTPLPDGSVGTLFFVETIEHLPPPVTAAVLRELRRLVTPKTGRLFITTPNDEELARGQVFCPGCHSVFHRYQHVESFDRRKLTETMEAAGFETIACDATDFGLYVADPPVPQRRSVLDLSIRDVLSFGKRLVKRSAAIASAPPAGPHLFWTGAVREKT